MDSDLLKYMMGHRPHNAGAYDNFDADYVRREYAKAESFLSISPAETSTKIVLPIPQAIRSNPRWNETDERIASPRDGRQRVITEWELDSYLGGGWQYVATLPSGRIIVGAQSTHTLGPEIS